MLVGGLGTYAQNITRKFVELGHDISVFTLNIGNLPTREVMGGVEVHRPLIADASSVLNLFVSEDLRRWGENIRFFSNVFMYNILSATKFANDLIRKEGYSCDIICFHDWLSSVSGTVIKNEIKDLPTVFHVHSTEWGRSGNQGSETVNKLEYTAAQSASRIITVSHAMRDDLARHGWPEGKIDVVWNAVEPDRYNPEKVKEEEVRRLKEKYRIAEDEQVILFVGRLNWVKGVRNLVQAMPMILNEFPKSKLAILGMGEQQKDIMELAQRLGVSDRVIYRFEFVPEYERILHYAAFDVCVFPSFYEPFGIVSLEAMSMEKPVVVGAKGVSGFREQVLPSGPEQCGMHIDGGRPDDIAYGVKEVLRDSERAKKWGKNGRERVLKYFSWSYAAQQTIDIYQSIISK